MRYEKVCGKRVFSLTYARDREFHLALTLTLSPRRGDTCAIPLAPGEGGLPA